jgi:GPH family glycoside/pentoside/hexuronide:cation symporter
VKRLLLALFVAASAQAMPAGGELFGDLARVLGDRRLRKLLTVFVVNGIASALPAILVLFFVADLTLPAALLADMADIAEAGNGCAAKEAQAGGYFGWWNLVAKLNLALAAGLSLPLLDLVGYRPGVAGATLGLSAVYCLLPLFFKIIAAVFAWRWRKILESAS